MNYKLIWVNGMPRSGTSWLSQIIASSENVNFKMAPLFSYKFKNSVDEMSTKEEWIIFFDNVFNTKDPFINQVERREKGDFFNFPKLTKQEFLCIKDVRYHEVIPTLLKYFSQIKIIHIVRNPCATISSWMNTEKEFKVDYNTKEDEWLTGKTRKINKSEYWGFNDWLMLTKHYLKLCEKYPDNVYIVSYERLVDSPKEETKKIFNFCKLQYTAQTSNFLKLSQDKHEEGDYSVFKSAKIAKNKWRNFLNPEIAEQIIATTKEEGLTQFLI